MVMEFCFEKRVHEKFCHFFLAVAQKIRFGSLRNDKQLAQDGFALFQKKITTQDQNGRFYEAKMVTFCVKNQYFSSKIGLKFT